MSGAVNVRPGSFFPISKHIQLENGSSTSRDVLIFCAFTQFTVFLVHFTHSLIGRAIALQRLRENCLLSMILKPNRLMRVVFNAHSVVQT